MTTDYRVHLDAFEGPLDLLLYLIRRAEVDIHDIPVAVITEQYLAYLGAIDRIDIDLAGEFLVMAATLMEIKSRMLTPPAQDASPGAASVAGGAAESDPRADLIRQLLAYKQYRDAADALEHKRQEWNQRFPNARAGVDDERLREAIAAQSGDLELEDISLVDLVECFQRIIATVNFDRLGEHQVVSDDTPIELHAEDILDRLRREGVGEGGAAGEIPLQSIFTGRKRGEMIGLFLAMLELVRRRALRVRQEAPGGLIVVGLRDAEEEPAAAPDPAP